jgi:uncharacterized protein DUF6221
MAEAAAGAKDGGTMNDLIAFLNARIDEDERYLKSNARHLWTQRPLREVAAKRVIVKRHQPGEAGYGPLEDQLYCKAESSDEDLWYANPWPCSDVLALAAVYSDHADYRPEWKP